LLSLFWTDVPRFYPGAKNFSPFYLLRKSRYLVSPQSAWIKKSRPHSHFFFLGFFPPPALSARLDFIFLDPALRSWCSARGSSLLSALLYIDVFSFLFFLAPSSSSSFVFFSSFQGECYTLLSSRCFSLFPPLPIASTFLRQGCREGSLPLLRDRSYISFFLFFQVGRFPCEVRVFRNFFFFIPSSLVEEISRKVKARLPLRSLAFPPLSQRLPRLPHPDRPTTLPPKESSLKTMIPSPPFFQKQSHPPSRTSHSSFFLADTSAHSSSLLRRDAQRRHLPLLAVVRVRNSFFFFFFLFQKVSRAPSSIPRLSV